MHTLPAGTSSPLAMPQSDTEILNFARHYHAQLAPFAHLSYKRFGSGLLWLTQQPHNKRADGNLSLDNLWASYVPDIAFSDWPTALDLLWQADPDSCYVLATEYEGQMGMITYQSAESSPYELFLAKRQTANHFIGSSESLNSLLTCHGDWLGDFARRCYRQLGAGFMYIDNADHPQPDPWHGSIVSTRINDYTFCVYMNISDVASLVAGPARHKLDELVSSYDASRQLVIAFSNHQDLQFASRRDLDILVA